MKRFILIFCCFFIYVPFIMAEENNATLKNNGETVPVVTEQPAVPSTDSTAAHASENEEVPNNQESGSNKAPSVSASSGVAVYEPIRPGDSFIKVGASLGVPLFNTSRAMFAIKPNIWPGGNITLGYNYYVTKGLSLGGEILFGFYPTLGSNLYFQVPITFNTMYTFVAGRWRFLLGGGLGLVIQAYTGTKYFGMIVKPQFEFYYQYSPEWSFGGGLAWSVMPQWYKDKAYNRIGNFLDIAFGVRYHF